MKTKALITTLALGLTIGIVSQAGAWMNGPGNQGYTADAMAVGGMGPGYGRHENKRQLRDLAETSELLKRSHEIGEKYLGPLQDAEEAVAEKKAELKQALGREKTTIGESNKLRTELADLRRELRSIRRTIHHELRAAAEGGFPGRGGWGRWNKANYRNHDERRNAMHFDDIPYGPRQMMTFNKQNNQCGW